MCIFHRQRRSGDVVGGLLGSAWRYKWLLAMAVLVGALVGYGWAARQPTLYEGVCGHTWLTLALRTHYAFPFAF